jgi:hypothetical protein
MEKAATTSPTIPTPAQIEKRTLSPCPAWSVYRAGVLLLFAAMKAASRSFTLKGETGFPIHRDI